MTTITTRYVNKLADGAGRIVATVRVGGKVKQLTRRYDHQAGAFESRQTTAEALANVVRSGTNRVSHELLSDREFQVMRRIAAGKTVSEIAEEIGLSVKTVSTYRARALEKLNMRTNSQFTQYAIRSGLIG